MNIKKNNIIVVAAIVLLIGLYQYFILTPYQQKQREWEAFQKAQLAAQNQTSQTTTPSENLDSATSGSLPVENTSPISTSTQVKEMSSRLLINELAVGQNRLLEIREGASLGMAKVTDYFVRNSDPKNSVNLNEKGLFWASNNPQIQLCLNSLTTQEETTLGFVQKATTENGSCELRLIPDAKHSGLLSMSLILSGFKTTSTDVLRLQGQGILGSSNEMDQNYLSYKLDQSIENIRGSSLSGGQLLSGKLDWLTWGDRYFSLIFKPTGLYNPNLRYQSILNEASPENQLVEFALEYPAQPELSKSQFEFSNTFYFGTRDTSILNEIDPELVETVDLGFFASVARVMLWALKALNTFLNNFGVSIIALTLIVRILFWPLNKKAYMSTIKMKELQPEMDRIRKKYDSKDRSQAEQMNKEIFALYRNKKVNPLGGCLPMLLQLPIFIGLYGALNHSIDLYQAPFFGWLTDLSLPDPFYILPIVWTLSLLGYLAINPQAMNTNQPGMPNMKWIMVGMNVFFGFLSKDWPAGLLVYLVVSNGVGLSQQFFLMRSNTKPQLIKEGV